MGQKVSGSLGDKVSGIAEEILLYHEDVRAVMREVLEVNKEVPGVI